MKQQKRVFRNKAPQKVEKKRDWKRIQIQPDTEMKKHWDKRSQNNHKNN